MTVIVWDGKVLAADRKSVFGSTPMRARKVFLVVAPNGRIALVGYSGSAPFVAAHLAWLRGGERPTFTHPEFKWSVLLIDDARNVWWRGESADYWERQLCRRAVIGSGSDYALGAMAHGADAVAAVRIASKLDIQCGMGVDVVRF